MESSKGASQEEVSRVQNHYEQKLGKLRDDLREKELSLDKARAQNAEITRELVEATNESGQAKNEARIIREKLKKTSNELQNAEAILAGKDNELQSSRNDQYQIVHKTKQDALKV